MAATTRTTEASSIRSSQADVWFLKEIVFGAGPRRRRTKVITQNFNGPCSFIAICNILILRDDITLEPYQRSSVSYEHLAQLVGDYLLRAAAGIDVSAALSTMPSTTRGLDLNPQFTAVDAFRPAGDGGALQLFARAGIRLVHGWLVGPHDPAAGVLTCIGDYDSAVALIADADHLTRGGLLRADVFGAGAASASPGPGPGAGAGADTRSGAGADADTGSGSGAGPDVNAGDDAAHSGANPSSVLDHNDEPIAGPSKATTSGVDSPSDVYSDEDRDKIKDATITQQFLDATKSQLTYHGLFQLAEALEPGSLVALFRNSHLSVLHKPEGEHTALYSLVTDHVFLHEPSVVWEPLADVDGGWSTFVDSDFIKADPLGGDFVDHVAPHDRDRQLAQSLQAQEDALAARQMRERRQPRRVVEQPPVGQGRRKHKEKDKCIIM